MPLTFPRDARHLDSEAASILFYGQDGEKTVACHLASQVLQERLGAGATGPKLLDAFDRNHPRIEAAASKKYDRQDVGWAVSVSLGAEDL
jgi:hypothetical protein